MSEAPWWSPTAPWAASSRTTGRGLSQVEDIPQRSNCCVVTYAFDEHERTFSCVDIYQPSCATMPQNVLNHKAGK